MVRKEADKEEPPRNCKNTEKKNKRKTLGPTSKKNNNNNQNNLVDALQKNSFNKKTYFAILRGGSYTRNLATSNSIY